jgi:hypothetical protein
MKQKQKTAMGNEQMTKAGPEKSWRCGGGKKEKVGTAIATVLTATPEVAKGKQGQRS